MKKRNVLIILFFVICDQFFKYEIINKLPNEGAILIKGIVNLNNVKNTGGAFGVASNSIISIIAMNILMIIILFVTLAKNENGICQIGISLILSGGISNLLDRILRGFVVDYIDISPIIRYPVFNIADILIVLGFFILMIYIIRYSMKKQEKDNNE